MLRPVLTHLLAFVLASSLTFLFLSQNVHLLHLVPGETWASGAAPPPPPPPRTTPQSPQSPQSPHPPAGAVADSANASACSAPQLQLHKHLLTVAPYNFAPLEDGRQFGLVPCIAPHCIFECQQCPRSQEVYDRLVDDYPWPEPQVCPTYTMYPIVFGAVVDHVVPCMPKKPVVSSVVVPGRFETYRFLDGNEHDYLRFYRNARFGMTRKKAGWDCNRHYEILKEGAVPYFTDIEQCPTHTMSLLPKDWLMEAKALPGLVYDEQQEQVHIDPQRWDETQYLDIACRLLTFMRRRLTTDNLARWMLNVTGNGNATKVLLMGLPWPDYLSDLLLLGFQSLLGDGLDYMPDMPFMLELPPETVENEYRKEIYGKGMGYMSMIERDRRSLTMQEAEANIIAHKYDALVFAGNVQMHHFAARYYHVRQILVVAGNDREDPADMHNRYQSWKNAEGESAWFFQREIPDECHHP